VKPEIGELWNITVTERVSVGNKARNYLISGPGLVVGIHRNHHDEWFLGDYYMILWGNEIREFLLSNFGEKIQ